jgi:hypothetical protein
MIRRRRPVREIPFSFDSFLDIVANVVGIIIRLILVVWVSARSYSSIQHLAQPPSPSSEAGPPPEEVEDPLQREFAQHQRELAQAQERLLVQLRRLQESERQEALPEGQWQSLALRKQRLEREQAELQRTAGDPARVAQSVALTSAEIRARSQKLADEIRALERLPAPKKTLRYRTPVSRPVQSEEILFECKAGRVTFIDIAALLAEVHFEDKAKLLRTQWQISGVTGTIGAYRLRYTVERERGLLESINPDTSPDHSGSFRYGISAWQIEPTALVRGETLDAALADRSEFRQIAAGLDPQQTAVTFWVYPDSFTVFRRLRDYLYERDITVAGRPLPDGVPIASSRRGTVSRGQ